MTAQGVCSALFKPLGPLSNVQRTFICLPGRPAGIFRILRTDPIHIESVALYRPACRNHSSGGSPLDGDVPKLMTMFHLYYQE